MAIVASLAVLMTSAAMGADLVGRVINNDGQPATGVQVSVADSSGAAAGSTLSDADGDYQITGLKPGRYTLAVKGQSVVSYVPKDGLTVNWGLSSTAPPIAIAKAGTQGFNAKVPKTK